MATLLAFIISVLAIIGVLVYSFILSGDLPIELSIIYTIFSLICFSHVCKKNIDDNKLVLYNIKNFIIVVFLNILLLPYISNMKIRYLTLLILFIVGLIVTLVILGMDKKSMKKKKDFLTYVASTLGICAIFEVGKIIMPFLHDSIIVQVLGLIIPVYIIVKTRKGK